MERSARLQQQIAGEAADWFARLQDPVATEADHDQFAQWLLRSPAHIEEYLAISRIWGDTPAATGVSVNDLVREAHAAPERDNIIALSSPSAGRLPSAAGTQPRRVRAHHLAVAAAILVVISAAAIVAKGWFHPSDIETAVGEQRSLTLRDGTVLHLNTDSAARIEFGNEERRITLTRGEARFTVVKDPARPFLVATRQATVRAVGTVFNVQASAERTTVTVIEGRVAIRSAPESPLRSGTRSEISTSSIADGNAVRGAGSRGEIELVAGERVAVTQAGTIVANTGPTVERALAWSDRRLVFRDSSLAEAVAEFNRYHERPIRIDDPVLAAIRISGTFNATDSRSLIEYLERYEHVRVREEPDGTQYLTR